MERRKEERIAVSFPVVVRGFDSRGLPFAVTAKTHDISATGASLVGLDVLIQPGKKIEIEYKDQKAWYRVERVDKTRGARAGRVGVRCLEPRKYIWGLPAARDHAPDHRDSSAGRGEPAFSPDPSPNNFDRTGRQRERRRFSRYSCRIEAQITTQGAYESTVLRGTIVDISLSGCYIEMLAPLPEDSTVELSFRAGTAALRLSGTVCSSQDGFGMGIAFTRMSPDHFEKLRQLAPQAANSSNANSLSSPSVRSKISRVAQASPHAARLGSTTAIRPDSNFSELPPAPEVVEAIVRLLLRKGLLTRAEFSEECEKLKIHLR